MNAAPSIPRQTWLATLIAGCSFFYFLIFAQFGFLHHLNNIESQANLIEMAMFAMGLGGIVGSILAARKLRLPEVKSWILTGFIGCGITGAMSLLTSNIWIQIGVALGVGLSLGSLTVAIVPLLRGSLPPRRIGLWASIAVGGAYFLSNLPFIFRCAGKDHCLFGTLACCVGTLLALFIELPILTDSSESSSPISTHKCLFQTKGVWIITVLFLGLIWLDSAAFYVIQNSDTLKASSWDTDFQLWLNAFIHLVIAILAGWALDRGLLFSSLIIAFGLLELGAWMLQNSNATDWGTYLYVSGVSIYSTALVAYGALAPESQDSWTIPKRAGMVFAIGGWFGSAMGIGMARDLHAIPLSFLSVALATALTSILVQRKLSRSASPAIAA